MIRVVGIGAGGHAKVVIDILQLVGRHEIVGLVEADKKLWKNEILGIEVLGGDELLADLYASGLRHAFIGVGSVGDFRVRKRLYESTVDRGFEVISAIHPASVVARESSVGPGATIMARAVINPGVRMGCNVIVNTGAIVEHECVIGNDVHIAPGAVLSGNVTVEDGAHIGAGAAIRQGLVIGAGALVAMGAVVVENVPPRSTVAGVPAEAMRSKVAKHDKY